MKDTIPNIKKSEVTDSLLSIIKDMSTTLKSHEKSLQESQTTQIKLDSISTQLSQLSNKTQISLWIPVIAAILTAVISSLIAQSIDRNRKNKRENLKDAREVHSKAVNAKIKLKDLFRQLALHKFHAQYWWHVHFHETDNDLSNKYYLEHLRAQSEARETEKQIGDEKANFLSEVVKFEKLKGKIFNVDKEKKEIEDIVFEKAKTYPDALSVDDLRKNHAEHDERELRESYFDNLKIFQAIINKMV